MKIGILQTGYAPDALRPTHGDYPDLFQKILAGHGFTFQTWRVLDMEFPSGPHDADGWLITGSRHGAYEPHPFIAPLEDLIRAIYAAHVPLVGVCFGHQIIAQALGGKVEKFKGGWSVGRTEYDWEGEPVALNAWHQDQVVIRPPGATLCATSAFCENAALVYDSRIFTVQAHPEYSQDWMVDMIEKRGRGIVPDPLLDDANTRLSARIDDTRIAEQIARFFESRDLALPKSKERSLA